MSFEDEVAAIAQRSHSQIENIETEEATKMALVAPMLQAWGYNIFDLNEVKPEFTADVGTKKGEKVDYAIFMDGSPSIIIECKKVGESLIQKQANQLYRYFTVTDAKFGILTDGVIYEFYSDLDENNRMDKRPFFVFNLHQYSDADIRELKKFRKQSYVEDDILSSAHNLKYARLIDVVLQQEFENPSEELTRLIGGKAYEGRFTATVMEWMQPLLKEAFNRVIRARVRANLESALDGENEAEVADQEVMEDTNDNGIVTTEQEIEAYNIVRAILSEVIPVSSVVMRDAKSYCAILFEDNNRKPIIRLYLDGKQWRIGIFKEKNETRHDVDGVTDIFKFSDALKATVSEYL